MELELIRRALHGLSEADSLDDLRTVLGRLFSGLGIAQYAFVRVDSTVLGTAPLLVSNHHACWQQLYRTHGYSRKRSTITWTPARKSTRRLKNPIRAN